MDWVLINLLVINGLSNSAYSLVAPFLPLEFDAKGIPATTNAYVFLVYSLAMMISSPLLGSIVDKYSLKILITAGMVLMTVSMISFAFIHLITEPALEITIVLLIRMMQGTASAIIQVSSYYLVGKIYEEEQ